MRTGLGSEASHLFNTDLPSLQGRPHLQLSASDLGLLGVLVCDMEAPQIMTADPHVLKNLLRCPRLTVMQTAALNALLASGKTQIGWVVPGIRVSRGPRELDGFLPRDEQEFEV